MEIKKLYTGRAIASFLLVLFSMPLGHGLMIAMEKTMSESAVHTAGFLLGFVGLIMGDSGCIYKRRYTANSLGIHWRLIVLDRVGRISVYVLCTALWSATRNREWRCCYQT